MQIDCFPWGIAEGKAFFNRNKESQRLANNIQSGRHTLLVSPRRYGKSSLAKHTIKLVNLPCAEVDLFLVIDDQSIEYRILEGIRALIQTVSDTPEQWFNTLRTFFNKINKKWTIGFTGLSLELVPDNHKDIADNLLNALNALEHILTKKNQTAVLFIDEFQEITKSKIGRGIEGAIRHFAQESKYLAFVFSGSNRHILASMFNSRSRPLYQLCDRINLEKIDSSYYKKYLDVVAKETWEKELPCDTFTKIIELTECHPNYVYILCSYIWQQYAEQKQPPKADDVATCWQNYINELLKETRAQLAKLKTCQLKLLIAIALGTNTELTGKETQKKLDASSAVLVYNLRVLENMDYIEKLGNQFHIINPVISYTLKMFYSDILNYER